MKKIGKKISFLTKIMLVFGLLVSNLSSLSVVFAYEAPDDVSFTLVEDELTIEYTKALTDVKKVRIDVYESYTYLDDFTDKLEVVEYEIDTTMSEEVKVTHPKNTFKSFDGTYKVVVEVYKLIEVLSEPVNELEPLENLTPEVTEELISTGTFEKEITYKSGLKLNVYDNNDAKVERVNGKYALSNSNSIRIDAYVLAGGLAPSDMFLYNEDNYTAEQLLELPFSTDYSFDGNLFGEYNVPVSVEVQKLVEEEVAPVGEELIPEVDDGIEEVVPEVIDNTLKYSTNIAVLYGSYEENGDILNNFLEILNMSDSYEFDGNEKNGTLYKFINLSEDNNTVVTGTMFDLYKVLDEATDGTTIKYQLLKGNEDLIKKYNDTYSVQEEVEQEIDTASEESIEENIPTVTLEDYLKEILIDETVKVTLTSGELTISYSVVILGDLTNDQLINNEDVLALIELVLKGVSNNKKADIDSKNGVNSLDVLYLQEVIKTRNWDVTLNKEDASLDLEIKTNMTEDETVVSGDEFIVDYTLKLSANEVSGFSGKLVYDKEALELISVESLIDSMGKYDKSTGKFLYLGEESLSLPEVTEEEPIVPDTPTEEPVVESREVVEADINDTTTPTVVTEDHVVLRAKFRALKSGNHTVSIKDTEYYNLNTYLNTGDLETEAVVEVLKSDDNKLSYLKVAGEEIVLIEDVFEYEITVKNEVTLVDLEYKLSNVAASVTSTIYPEELVEGVNEVTITVTSESGITQDYKVKVTREEAVKETTTKVNYNNNYQPNYDKPVEEPEPVVPVEPEEPKDEKEVPASKIVIIVLIVLVIGGLVYLIFKDEKDDTDANKKINKLKKDSSEFEDKQPKKVVENKTTSNNNKNTNSSKKNNNSSAKNKTNQKNNNKKKER